MELDTIPRFFDRAYTSAYRGRVYGAQGFGGFPSGFPVTGNGEVKKPDWRGTYHKYFGEASVAHFDTSARGNQRVMGATVRATWVKVNRLTLNDVPAYEPSMLYFEPSWFWRLGSPWLQGQATVGISVPCGKMREEQKSVLADGSVLLGLGVIIMPAELYKKLRID
ncbi:hypothetical protein [Hymenobacter sp. HDW8]|uniref:hypothetical protein n=1 Tax=Hymenobacter sp. HDW8 TaxID=2714932 RepID=UPI00140A5EE3|nr:hypothetical protein [Hymenobacter sp. HDW8]QIL77097.1 hypothetical protein G7064_15505 [Hymenobacter sp. HDW8]